MNYITPKEAARQLSVSPKTIIRAARRGELQAIQIGRQWRVQQSSLQALAESNVGHGTPS
ncbi:MULTISPECIES: helix-turn-helix domain-containing protein [unclassified Deinococcus]|uniref:helix-turn-helix domain-containing protein n=1 Tax=unclassified Deinococcus TaxID=2623546 RepID=UPI001C303314|nr:helix-turn-helix domain-containing protein [Deinococcus sp. 43]MDK2010991.1 helix-turn-helix domain-containing protein [Deinococcus sp. 43]